MKRIQLLHNPGAGGEEHSKEELIRLIEANGFECRYSSTKEKGWKNIEPEVDLLAIAGGDGTVRDVAGELLHRRLIDGGWPLALLPLGTANNIAKTLNLSADINEIIQGWRHKNTKRFDVGRVNNGDEDAFFLEGFGFGIFPYLMKQMQKEGNEDIEQPEEKLKAALQLLHQIVLSYEACPCSLEVDGTDHSGKFLLVEIMNIRSIGPNLVLSPLSDPGDGEFEVVLVPEQHKEKFAAYVHNKLTGREETYLFHTLKARNIRIRWEGKHVHVDDKLMKLEKGTDVQINLKPGLLEFLAGA